MKRICKCSMLLVTVLTLCALLAACTTMPSGTIPATDSTTPTVMTTTTEHSTTTTAPAPEPPLSVPTWNLLDPLVDWHYKTFLCPYDSTTVGGNFDPATDEMAKWLAEQGDAWYIDALDEMRTWGTATAPFGDRYNALSDPFFVWQGDYNGIILYTTFTLTADQMKLLESVQPHDIYMNIFYDNTISIYINNTYVFADDNGTNGMDWNDDFTVVPFSPVIDLRDILREGENTVVVSLKNTFGGREFLMGLEAKMPYQS